MLSSPPPIIVEQIVSAPRFCVWRALTDTIELRRWYFPIDTFEPVPGREFNFYAGPPGKLYHHHCVIIDAIPQARLSYTWRYPDLYSKCNTLVTWELDAISFDKTRIRLTHTGVDAFPKNDRNFARASFIGGWKYIVGTSLKRFVETKTQL